MSIFNTVPASYNAAEVGKLQGANFAFFGAAAIDGQVMENMLRSLFTITDQADNGNLLLNSLFSPGLGYHHFSLTTSASLCSMKLPIASEGMMLVIDGRDMIGDANVIFEADANPAGITGASLIYWAGSAISRVSLSAVAWLKLMCVTDGLWSVIEYNGSCTFTAAA